MVACDFCGCVVCDCPASWKGPFRPENITPVEVPKSSPMKQQTKAEYLKQKRDGIRRFNETLAGFNKELKGESKPGLMRRIKEMTETLDGLVRSDDPRMQNSVVVNHQDGSHFYFSYAWLEKLEAKVPKTNPAYSDQSNVWILVFTEHQGAHFFNAGDLDYYHQLNGKWK